MDAAGGGRVCGPYLSLTSERERERDGLRGGPARWVPSQENTVGPAQLALEELLGRREIESVGDGEGEGARTFTGA